MTAIVWQCGCATWIRSILPGEAFDTVLAACWARADAHHEACFRASDTRTRKPTRVAIEGTV